MVDFALSEVELDIRDRARAFVTDECLPLESTWPLSDYDADPHVVEKLQRRFTDLGFRGMAIPVESGGGGYGTLAKCLAFEEFKKTWVLSGNTLTWSAFLDPHPLLYSASADMRSRYLDPILEGRSTYHICISEPEVGSDVAGLRTTATRDGDHYVINGLKRWSPDPAHPLLAPDYLLVYARTGPGDGARGISTFIVDYPSAGIQVRNQRETVAHSGFLGRVCDMEFTQVRVPVEARLGAEGKGFHYVQDQLNRNRTVIGAAAVGTAERALADAIAYAKSRQTFGGPLSERQAVQWMIAESRTEIEMGRMLAHKAAWLLDQGQDARAEVAMTKSFCPEMAARVVDRVIQILGGIGVLQESRLGQAYWTARLSKLAEGSTEMMKTVIAKEALR